MLAIYRKEVNAFLSSLMGYLVIGLFVLITGLMMWVFPDYSILEYNYATLEQLFSIAPLIFIFLIPAITMRSFAEEQHTGTIELLVTRPITDWSIILGKFLACWSLVGLCLLPTLLYYISVYQLGAPKGNLDSGGIIGSYIGLLALAGVFVAIGICASSLTRNQIVAFVLATFMCFVFYWGFSFISKLPIFEGRWDDFVQRLGIEYHYASMSRGVIDTRDVLYFGSVIYLFLAITKLIIDRRTW